MKARLTDKEIQRFFWEAKELPDDNKASFLLGDLTQYGVSRYQKLKEGWKEVWKVIVFKLIVILRYNFPYVLDTFTESE